MSKAVFVGVGILILSLSGCDEMNSNNAQPGSGGSGRSGAVGVTTQDIDDLGKPASKTPAGSSGGSAIP
jgi:hypothetical protein